jgi:oxalate---CoA ligase
MPVPHVSKGSLDLEAELLALWRRLLKSEAVTVNDDFLSAVVTPF